MTPEHQGVRIAHSQQTLYEAWRDNGAANARALLARDFCPQHAPAAKPPRCQNPLPGSRTRDAPPQRDLMLGRRRLRGTGARNIRVLVDQGVAPFWPSFGALYRGAPSGVVAHSTMGIAAIMNLRLPQSPVFRWIVILDASKNVACAARRAAVAAVSSSARVGSASCPPVLRTLRRPVVATSPLPTTRTLS